MKKNKKAAPNDLPFENEKVLQALLQAVGPGDWLYTALLSRAVRDHYKAIHHKSRSHKRLATEPTGTDFASAWKSAAR